MSRLSHGRARAAPAPLKAVIAGLRTLKQIDMALQASSLRHVAFWVIWSHYRLSAHLHEPKATERLLNVTNYMFIQG